MIRESEVADAPLASLSDAVVKQAVVQIACLEVLHAAHAASVQQVVVDVVCLQFFERILKHVDALPAAPSSFVEVGELRGDVVRISGVSGEGYAGGFFAVAATVGRRRVKVVHAVGQCVVHQAVDRLLINLSILLVGQSHHAVAQERYFVACGGVLAVGHLVSPGFLQLAVVILDGACFGLGLAPCEGGGHAGGSCAEEFQEVASFDMLAHGVFFFAFRH